MPKITGTFTAVDRYDLVKDAVAGGFDKHVPADAVRHAVLFPDEEWIAGSTWAKVTNTAVEPIFAEKGHGLDAVCGRWVKGYLPEVFDSEHPLACPRCMETIGAKGR